MTKANTDILIVGGGLGGIAAAISAARLGRRVVVTEETDWLGGQLTVQAVPPDEHRWIERFGCTATYRALRDGIRAYYRRHYPVTPRGMADPAFNPGASLVTRIGGEPKVGLAVLRAMLAPYEAAGRIRVLYGLRPTAVATDESGDRVRGVTLVGADGGEVTIAAPYILDATETGDLLPLAKVEHVTGKESRARTGEPGAIDGAAEPLDMQSITWVFALDHCDGEDHRIARPAVYDFWRKHQADYEINPHFSWHPKKNFDAVFFPDDTGKFSVWQYRRVLYAGNFAPGFLGSDVTLINAPHNDYRLGPIIGVDEAERLKHLEGARELSLSFLYWLQHDAPRPDGGAGWPGLRLRPDVTGTADGLAKAPYIREGRRIRAAFTVLEQHVGVKAREGAGSAEPFPDSVGIGCYSMDRHPTTGIWTSDHAEPLRALGPTWPFQIPLGALIPERVENLLPAAKNIGTTHLTNSCYRLHPIEWNIGEAAGALAAYCLKRDTVPIAVRETPELLADYQQTLVDLGVELEWPTMHESLSYHKWAIRQARWDWAETDRMPAWVFWGETP